MAELRHCPFCGSAGILYDYHGKDYRVECINNSCPASYMIGKTFDSADEAIEVWNTRVKVGDE